MKELKTTFSRVRNPVQHMLKLTGLGQIKGKPFLCRKGKNYFISLVFFTPANKMDEDEVVNVINDKGIAIGRLYVIWDATKVNVDELSEILELKLQ